MENNTKKSRGVDIPKRGRSLDLKSLYKTRASEVGEGKKKISKESDQQNVKKRGRSRKEVSLKCFESDPKKSKEDVDSMKPDIGVKQKLSGRSKGLPGISLALGENGNAFNFPKRPRGSVGHKKSKVDYISKPLVLSNSVDPMSASNAKVKKLEDESAANDQSARLVTVCGDGASNSKSVGKVSGSNSKAKQKVNSESTNKASSSDLNLKRKARADEVKGRSRRQYSDGNAEKECSITVNNGDTSSKKQRGSSRKKMDLVDGRDGAKASKKKPEPSVGNSVSDRLVDFDEEDDDDEENLEQNAARMLSSRFDPSCTGFSLKRKISASQRANGSSFPVSSTQNSFSLQANSSGGVNSASADDTSRALRPRREDKGKDIARKRRRHFYEIIPRNLEPHWFLDRRIKVFWPLDESWYGGLVNDYHPECKLYHIKYDDRDEEWIDLQEEKFKILLFPSEVPGKAKSNKVYEVDSNVHKLETVWPEASNRHRVNYHDSEPTASWIACSSQHVKSLPKSLETPGTLHMELPTVSSSSHEKTGNLNSKVVDSKRTRSKKDLESTSANNSLAGGAAGIRAVYVRKKNRKRGETYGSDSGTVDHVAPVTVHLPSTEEKKLCYRCADSEIQLSSINRQGQLRLLARLMESKKFRFHTCLPVLSSIRFLLRTEYFWFLHDILMVQLGIMLPTSPAVMLEMLFMDNDLGLRFFMFEGFMELALAFIFQLLDLFNKPDQQMDGNMQSPVTSIRFRLSSVQDIRKHHIFEFHCFSRLPSSNWICLNSSLQRHCLLLKQLSVSECTYDNIKELEYGSLKQCRAHFGLELSLHKGMDKHFFLGSLPKKVSKEACTTRFGPSALNLARYPGKFPQFIISFSVVPTFFLTGHLQLIIESSSGRGNLEALCSPKSLENGNRNCVERSQSGCLWQGHRSNSVIPSLADRSPMIPGESPKVMRIGFSNGPKKPRTQVQYTLPDAVYDVSSKQKMQNHRAPPCKRIRRASLKRVPDVSVDNQRNIELLTCGANVLVTHVDKGWRECGALVVLECADHNEWRLAIKLSGVTKYSYKVKHALQPGSTNRYSHAILWKGGKDWVLEFADRSQWNLFKEMYEECYSRNIRAASVKYIPIPGVKLIEGSGDYGSEVLSNWSSADYFRQVQTDIEMALDPSQILYDLDNDDEQWLMANNKFNDDNRCEEISDELLEKIMDMFEKVSYVQHRDNFTDAEIQEIVIGIGSVEASKVIYEHWHEKRRGKGMPLIRHLQPPLWQRYQQQLREWECSVARVISANCAGTQEKAPPPEKPPMFAFCLKPRGLDVPNKDSKPRSHRKFTVSGHLHHTASGDHYSSLVYGRRPNGYIFGDEKVLYTSGLYEFSDFLPSLWSSNRKMKRYKARRRKNRRYKNRCGVMEWNMGLPYSSVQRHYYFERSHREGVGNMDLSDLNDLQLREASFVAQHARNIAKLKREKARRLSNRADIAIHKAAVALMTADAVKAAYEDSKGVTK